MLLRKKEAQPIPVSSSHSALHPPPGWQFPYILSCSTPMYDSAKQQTLEVSSSQWLTVAQNGPQSPRSTRSKCHQGHGQRLANYSPLAQFVLLPVFVNKFYWNTHTKKWTQTHCFVTSSFIKRASRLAIGMINFGKQRKTL